MKQATPATPRWFKEVVLFVAIPIVFTAFNSLADGTCVAPPSGLVSWWPAEGNANDIFGTNNGILQGGVSFAVGEVGQAFSFDGMTGNVKVPAGSSLNVGTGSGMTVEMWINPTTLDAQPLAEWNDNAGNIGAHLWVSASPFGSGASGDLYANVVDTNGASHFISTGGGVVSSNNSQHVALTYDKTSGMAVLYWNGAAVATQSLGVFTPQTSYDLYFGLRPSGFFSGSYFGGAMDEASIYNRALSASEIQGIYNAGSAGKCPTGGPSLNLIDVNFYAALSPGLNATKTGLAATGHTTNDFWNEYSRDNGSGGWLTFGVLTNLKTVESVPTGAGLTVANAPGCWANGSSDPMYNTFIYPFNGGNVTVTITNLPAGRYNFYIYSWDGKFDVTSGTTDYGTQTTYEHPVTNPPVWTPGVQYDLYTNVAASSGQPVVITAFPGQFGTAVICGLQILQETSNPPPACVPPPSGLVSWWRAEGNANDAAGTNNGTLQGGVTFAPGEVGQAFALNGTNAYIKVPASSSLNVGAGSGLTFEAWINPTTVNRQAIAEWDNGAGGLGVLLFISDGPFGVGPAGNLVFNVVDGTGASHIVETGGGVVTPNTFQHVAATYDKGTGTAVIYLNGAPVLTQSVGAFAPQTSYDLYFGTRVSGFYSGAYFGGEIDEPSLYNRALTGAEIQAIYNAGSGGKCLPTAPPRQSSSLQRTISGTFTRERW
jgi:Concanavalin A-like lectin/glucanases superfamily